MLINIFLPEYNWIFKYYLLSILLFNLSIIYNFIFRIPTKINSINFLNDNVEDKYIFMFKKIIKIAKNPIIFEYQLKQIKTANINDNKYNQYKKYLKKVKNKQNNLYKQYKILKKIFYKKNVSHTEFDEILIKLLCVNF